MKREAGAFSTGEQDMGCIRDLQMKVRLTDDIPVQRTYQSIPRPLYQEVRTYLQDLIERGWIVKSESPYAYPVVCVRKKDGGLHLCVDYRGLNSKQVPGTPSESFKGVMLCYFMSLRTKERVVG